MSSITMVSHCFSAEHELEKLKRVIELLKIADNEKVSLMDYTLIKSLMYNINPSYLILATSV